MVNQPATKQTGGNEGKETAARGPKRAREGEAKGESNESRRVGEEKKEERGREKEGRKARTRGGGGAVGWEERRGSREPPNKTTATANL